MKIRPVTVLLGLGIVAAIYMLQGTDVLHYWQDRLGVISGAQSSIQQIKSAVAEAIQAPEPENKKNSEEVEDLNDRGVKLILNRHPWEGMYYLDKAIQKNPQRIIPMVNMAVVLTDLGLNRPAARYLEMARKIDPNHPWLKKNFPGDLASVGDFTGTELDVKNDPADIQDSLPMRGLADDDTMMLWGVDVLGELVQ